MSEYILIATSHEIMDGPIDNLMSSECTQNFKRDIDPLITDKTVVFCEGIWYDGLLRPEHPSYEFVNKRLLNTSAKPTLGGCDFRQIKMIESGNDAEASRHFEHWEEISLRKVRHEKIDVPETLSGIIEFFQKHTLKAQLTQEPTREDIDAARYIYATSRKFNRLNLEAMRKHGPRFDRCLFVGGASHVVAMALKSHYSVLDLTPQHEKVELFHSYYTDYHIAPLFLKIKK